MLLTNKNLGHFFMKIFELRRENIFRQNHVENIELKIIETCKVSVVYLKN